jgi:hypothetical protein
MTSDEDGNKIVLHTTLSLQQLINKAGAEIETFQIMSAARFFCRRRRRLASHCTLFRALLLINVPFLIRLTARDDARKGGK